MRMKLVIQILILQLCLLRLHASPIWLGSDISLTKTVRAGSCSAAFITCPSTRVSQCAASSTSSTACPARRLTSNDDVLYQRLKDTGGDREFFPPIPTTNTDLNSIQSLGVSFALTYNSLHPRLSGTRTYSPIGSPGWDELPEDLRERGHLWGKDMGGSGGYYLNIITLTKMCNKLMNEEFECPVKEAFELMDLDKLSRVFVTILVRYDSSKKTSKKIFLFADVEYQTSSGWVMEPWLGMSIKNTITTTVERLFPDRTSTIKSASVKTTLDTTCVSQSTTINTLGFFPQMSSTNNAWWTLFRPTGAPSVSTGDGELWFNAEDQTEDARATQISSRQIFGVGRGLVFRFQISPYRFESSEMTFSLPGGIILRFQSGQGATWNTINTSGYSVLATSAMTTGRGWWDVQIVYTRSSVVLSERGVKKFTLSTVIPDSLFFTASFKNSDKNVSTYFKFSNVAVQQNLF